MENTLKVIDADLVRELRRGKKYVEADNLLKAYQEDKNNNKHILERELINQNKRVKNFENRKNGLCSCGKERIGGKSKCARCREYRREYRLIKIFKCRICKKARRRRAHYCDKCRITKRKETYKRMYIKKRPMICAYCEVKKRRKGKHYCKDCKLIMYRKIKNESYERKRAKLGLPYKPRVRQNNGKRN